MRIEIAADAIRREELEVLAKLGYEIDSQLMFSSHNFMPFYSDTKLYITLIV
jgi:hypothetical protein